MRDFESAIAMNENSLVILNESFCSSLSLHFIQEIPMCPSILQRSEP